MSERDPSSTPRRSDPGAAARMRAKRDRDRAGLSAEMIDVDKAVAWDGLIAVGMLTEPQDDSPTTTKTFRRALSRFVNDALRRAAKNNVTT